MLKERTMSQQVAGAQPDPALIWNTMNGYQKTAALKAGVELDVFTAIGEGAGTPDELAKRCDTSVRGVRILCDFLTIEGFLAKADGRYSLTPTSAVFLDTRSPACMGSVLTFVNSPKVMANFNNLTATVRKGGALSQGLIEDEFAGWVTFAESM